jgi:Holliday junction resolvase RusA-like endonuclease
MIIELDITPLSMNMAYPRNPKTGRRYLSDRGKVFKDYVMMQTTLCLKGFKIDKSKEYLAMEYHFFCSNLFKKDGTLTIRGRPDTSNCIKLTEDAVSKAIGVDDYLCLDIDRVTMNYAPKSKIIVFVRKELISKKKSNHHLYNDLTPWENKNTH